MQGSIKDLRRVFPAALQKRLPKEILVIPLNQSQSLALNRRYRHKNKPANVLSFFYGKEYGEIIVCPARIRAEAGTQGNSFSYQMTWMILHGMLHLAGIHHEKSEAAAKRAGALERKILAGFTSL